MCIQFLRKTEQLINVALPIADMHAASRITEQLGGLTQVLQPADALLLLNRHARRVDPALQSIGAMEFVPAPELDSRQSERQTISRNHQAGVHQNAAVGVERRTPFVPCRYLVQDSDRC